MAIDLVRLASSSTNLLDVRSADDFFLCHMKDSVSIPFSCLLDRMGELPPRGAEICVIGTEEESKEAESALVKRSYIVTQTIVWSPSIEGDLENNELLRRKELGSCVMWTASPCLADSISMVESSLLENGVISSLEKAEAMDLACGCGRDVVFLAKRKWGRVIGIDYLKSQIERVKILLKNCSIDEENVELIEHDLEKNGLPLDAYPESLHLVTVARYLHRPHFPLLKKLIAPGGFLIFHTFMKGCETSAVGRPRRPQFLLDPGELAKHFGESTGFEILVDEVKNITDGRPTSFFVARRCLPSV